MLNILRRLNNTKKIYSRLFIILLLVSCVSLFTLYPQNSYATTPPACTTDINGIDNPKYAKTSTTLISDIVLKIKARLFGITSAMYLFTTSDMNFIAALYAIITLYIIVYAISFMIGIIQIKLYDIIIRMVKIGVIISLFGPFSWAYFNEYLIGFFDSGVDEIISYLTSGGTPIGSSIPIVGPYLTSFTSANIAFQNIDSVVGTIFSAKTFVTLLALFMAKPYGIFYFAIMMIALWSFIRSLMTVMWVYIMSLVVRTILLGLAPIFIPTIMFQRTRHIFDGWLNQLVSASLQPIMLFVFFIFFVKLMQGSMDTILSTPVCFSKYPEGWRGSSFDFSFWKFATRDPATGWVPSTDEWKISDKYPVNVMAIYTFLLVSEIGNRFNNVVVQIAAQIAQTGTSLVGTANPMNRIKGAFMTDHKERHSGSNANSHRDRTSLMLGR